MQFCTVVSILQGAVLCDVMTQQKGGSAALYGPTAPVPLGKVNEVVSCAMASKSGLPADQIYLGFVVFGSN